MDARVPADDAAMERMNPRERVQLALFACAVLGACEARREREVRGDVLVQERSTSAPASAATQPASAERSFARIAGADEPGEPLEVSGRVFEPDGVTPAASVVVYVYHTDAEGHYSREPDAPPRLRAWMLTDAEGRFRYRTIKPAPYPQRSAPAHVHTQLWSERFAPQYNTDLEFRDDPLLRPGEIQHSDALGTFAYVVRPERGTDGVLRATHNLRLKASGDVFEDSIEHGVRDAPADLRPRRMPPNRRG